MRTKNGMKETVKMEWASEENENPPSFNQLAVAKVTIGDVDYFKTLVGLYGLKIIQEEKEHFILDGRQEDLEEFSRDWNWESK